MRTRSSRRTPPPQWTVWDGRGGVGRAPTRSREVRLWMQSWRGNWLLWKNVRSRPRPNKKKLRWGRSELSNIQDFKKLPFTFLCLLVVVSNCRDCLNVSGFLLQTVLKQESLCVFKDVFLLFSNKKLQVSVIITYFVYTSWLSKKNTII